MRALSVELIGISGTIITSAIQEHALGDPGPSLQEFAKRRKNYRIRAQCALYRWSLLGFLGPSSAFDGYRAGRRVRDSRLHRRRVHRPIPALHDGESETLSLDPRIALSKTPRHVEAFRQTVPGGGTQVVFRGFITPPLLPAPVHPPLRRFRYLHEAALHLRIVIDHQPLPGGIRQFVFLRVHHDVGIAEEGIRREMNPVAENILVSSTSHASARGLDAKRKWERIIDVHRGGLLTRRSGPFLS